MKSITKERLQQLIMSSIDSNDRLVFENQALPINATGFRTLMEILLDKAEKLHTIATGCAMIQGTHVVSCTDIMQAVKILENGSDKYLPEPEDRNDWA